MKSAALVILLCCALSLSGQECLTFTGPVSLVPPGAAPTATVVADLNGDGRADLAVVNSNSHDIAVFLNTGGATFGPPTTFPAGGPFPWDLVTGDFNEDGRIDLAVTLRNFPGVAIHLGNGDGTFGVPAIFPTTGNGNPTAIAIGDYNEDGNADLAVAGFSAITIRLGNGTGLFGAPLHFPSATPWDVVTADFNADGHLDLATAQPFSNRISIMFGIGNGGFGPETFIPVQTNPRALVAGNFNSDSLLDLAVSNQDSGTISIVLATGPGTFAAPVHYPTTVAGDPNPNPPFPSPIETGDFNGDGITDLVVTNFGRNNFVVFTGTGSGTFDPAVPFGVVPSPVDVTVADVDGNGSPDVIVTSILPSLVSVFLNACAAAETPVVPLLSPAALLLLAAVMAMAGIVVMRR
jgi:FG-GAP-like repeat